MLRGQLVSAIKKNSGNNERLCRIQDPEATVSPRVDRSITFVIELLLYRSVTIFSNCVAAEWPPADTGFHYSSLVAYLGIISFERKFAGPGER